MSLDPDDCALIIGLTYLVSSILSLILKHLIGRRVLLLLSQAGMGLSMLATGLYFHTLAPETSHTQSYLLADHIKDRQSWLLLPVLQIFTFFYNIGLGSLIWTVATEILPPR